MNGTRKLSTLHRRQLLWFGAACTLSARAGAVPTQTLVVIVGSGSPADISLALLQRIFGGDHVTSGGRRVIPFNHPPRSWDREAFDQVVLKMNADEVARYWIDRKIRGQLGPPRIVPSPALLKRVVAQLPGAMGYLRAAHLDDSVRAATIEGKAYTEPGYPLILRG